jgi:hypothetical protein
MSAPGEGRHFLVVAGMSALGTQHISSLQRSGSSGFWGGADAAGALPTLVLVTRPRVARDSGVELLNKKS